MKRPACEGSRAALLGSLLVLLAACSARPIEEHSHRAEVSTPVIPPEPQVATAPLAIPVPVPPCLPPEEPKPRHRFHRREKPKPVTAPSPQAPAVQSAPPGPVNAQVGELQSAVMPILGRRVQGPKGEDLGRIVDVLADAEGRVRVAIIDFGGFLGVGNRRIAVDWPLLHFDPSSNDKPVSLDVTREKLQSAPEFKDSSRPRVLMPASVAASQAPPAASAAPSAAGGSAGPAPK